MQRIVKAVELLRNNNYRHDLELPLEGKRYRGAYRFQIQHFDDTKGPEIMFKFTIDFGDWGDHRLLEQLEKMDFEIEKKKGHVRVATASLVIPESELKEKRLAPILARHRRAYFGIEGKPSFLQDPVERGTREDAAEKQFHDKLVQLFIRKRP